METDDTILNISSVVDTTVNNTTTTLDYTDCVTVDNTTTTLDYTDWLIDDLSFADTITIDNSTNSDFVINRPGKPPLKVAETLECIMDRLAILEPDFDKMEKYPALKEAYDNYKIIEGMLLNNDSDD